MKNPMGHASFQMEKFSKKLKKGSFGLTTSYLVTYRSLKKNPMKKKTTDDRNKVVSLILATGIGETEILKTVRIGKISNKPRLIKVTLSSSVIVREIVTKYRTRNGIYVNRDLTKMQQDVAYKTRKEFKERVNKGEKNISLKYYNGVPKIVTKNNH
ncbi:hypothetical protein Zmor_021979 [Zophobas morio]|uniref:Uncharacterized protein n=1 Tax=Zophobas morio TaxID=2755281 RepID=A0AA38I7D1_9CUCU|nr:hypothetical protein Zmor_021979 [Zophobas morio]